MKRRFVFALIAYMFISALPGLFGIEPGSSVFIAYQAFGLLALFLYVVYSMFKYRSQISVNATSVRFVVWYVSLLLLSGVYTALLAFEEGSSLLTMAQFFLPALITVIFMLGFGNLKLKHSEIETVLIAIVALAFLSSIYNIAINLNSILSLASITGSYQVDLKGFYFNRNVFAFMMSTGMASAIYLWSINKKFVYIIAMATIGISLIAAMSRGGFLLLGLFVVFFVLINTKHKIRALITVGSVFLIFLAIVGGSAFFQDNILRLDNSDTGRTSLRSFGVNYYLNHNLLLGDGQRAITTIQKEFDHNSYHNLYVESLVTQGLVGVVIVLMGALYSYGRIKIVKKENLKLGAFFQAYLFAYLIYIFIEALPLFYATPNSVVATYIIILLPTLMANGIIGNNKRTDIYE